MSCPRSVPVLLVAALAAAAATAPAPAAAAAKKPSVRLKAFETCTGLIRYGNRHRGRVEAMRMAPSSPMVMGDVVAMEGRPMPAMAPAASGGSGTVSDGADSLASDTFSTTNVQEAGVDEPDVIKTDGKRIFAFARNALHTVDLSGSAPAHKGVLKFGSRTHGHQMLLDGNTLLVAYQEFVPPPPPTPQPGAPTPETAPAAGAASVPAMFGTVLTKLAQVDVSDLSAPRIVRTLDVEGSLVDARLTGTVARVVLSTTPPAMQVLPVASGPGATDQRARGSRRANHWLPRGTFRSVRAKRVKRRALTACRATRRPASFSGMGMLTILTIDLSKGLEPVDSDSLMSDAETVYASTESLYVATRKWAPAPPSPADAAEVPSVTTTIHKFDISDPGKTVYKASGAVPGYLLSQWSMSERDGVLRVASTTTPTWWNFLPEGVRSESFVHTLSETAGVLAVKGSVGGLGKGERIYAVRFIGDVGYVVTFRQTDPLYTIDVKDPAKPAVLGELKILGYSAYLHPAGEGLLIGVGQDATEEGRRTGAQISLFDVTDLKNPTRLHQANLGSDSQTQAEYDHHAFLYWDPTKLAVIPLTSYQQDKQVPFNGAVGFRIDRTAIAEVGRIQHPFEQWPSAISRSLVVGERLYTLSDLGLQASALGDLSAGAWVAWPAP